MPTRHIQNSAFILYFCTYNSSTRIKKKKIVIKYIYTYTIENCKISFLWLFLLKHGTSIKTRVLVIICKVHVFFSQYYPGWHAVSLYTPVKHNARLEYFFEIPNIIPPELIFIWLDFFFFCKLLFCSVKCSDFFHSVQKNEKKKMPNFGPAII